MKTINQLVITVGILLCSLAVWADDAAEKASLETYFSWRGTNYIDVIALADENQALRDSVNTLYKNSFAVIDTVGGEYIFQGFITLDGVAPDLGKKDSLYISADAAAYLGDNDYTAYLQSKFKQNISQAKDEIDKCTGEELIVFGELPCRVEGINYAISGGMTYVVQKLMKSGNVDIAKCVLNSDIYFKAAARLMDLFGNSTIYKAAKKKPLIYEVPLAKAKRLEILSRDTLDYLHFVGLNGEDTVRLNKYALLNLSILPATFEYSKDRKTWTAYDTWGTYGDPVAETALGAAIELNQGDTVFFRAKGTNGKNATLSIPTSNFAFAFGADDSIAAGGNIMSLYDATCEQNTMTDNGFLKLFSGAKQLVSAPKLPATKLAMSCYSSMFNGCTSLTAAPELKAETLAKNCYVAMFQNCSSLTAAPELKASTLADWCYHIMFSNCTSLEVDTCTGNCDGAELVVPTVSGTAPTNWNSKMFEGCKGDAKYTAQYGIKLGGHYCIKEYVPEITGITLTDYNADYDGQPHSITMAGTIEGDVVSYSADSATWQASELSFKNIVADTVVYVKIQRAGYQDWGGSAMVTITAKQLTISGTTIAEKNYDGMFDATVSAVGTLEGVVSGEDVKVTATATFNDRNAGKQIDVSVEYSLEGADAGNYLAPVATTMSANITPRPITLQSADLDKLYDNTALTAYSLPGGTTITVADGSYVADECLNYSFSGSQLDAGYSDNTFTVSDSQTALAANYNVTSIYGMLTINPRKITITSATDSKPFDGKALTNDQLTFTGDGFVGSDTVNCTVTGKQTKVGNSDNTFTYTFSGKNENNYTIKTVIGKLYVYNSIFPEIVGMYDKWNIVLDRTALIDTLAKVGITADIEPKNVSWYIVNGDKDEVDPIQGTILDDIKAVPFTGLFHTEDKAMSGQYYAVVYVPEAQASMGISIFQSNVVFVETPAPTAPTRKEVRNGQLIIVKDGQMYNALGGKL